MKMKKLKYLITALAASTIVLTSCGPTNADGGNTPSGEQQTIEESFEEAQERLINEKIYSVQDLVRNIKDGIKLVLNESKNHFSDVVAKVPEATRIEAIFLAALETLQDDKLSQAFFMDMMDKANDLANLYTNYPYLIKTSFDELITDINNTLANLEQSELLIGLAQSNGFLDPYYTYLALMEMPLKIAGVFFDSLQQVKEEQQADPGINVIERFEAIVEEKIANESKLLQLQVRTFLAGLKKMLFGGDKNKLVNDLLEKLDEEQSDDYLKNPVLIDFENALERMLEIVKPLIPGMIKDNPKYNIDQIRLLAKVTAYTTLKETEPRIAKSLIFGWNQALMGTGTLTYSYNFPRAAAEYDDKLNALINEELAKVAK